MRPRLRSILKYWQNLAKNRRWFLVFTCLVSLGLVFGWTHAAWGADPPTFSDNVTEVASKLLLYVAQFLVRVALFFLAFIIQLAGYNGYLNAETVQIGWVMVRDITNMFFVVLLLMIAFGTILGIEQYEWKKLIVKFAFAALLVNFSRIICGLFIDISQLVMNTFVNGIAATAGGNFINMFNFQSIFKFQNNLKGEALTTPGVFTASLAALIFAGEVMIVFGIFVFMLAARLVRLWILIVLSPIAFALNVVPLTQKFAGQWWTEFADSLVTGPVLLFFIWLSFVSLSGGDVNSKIAAESNIPEQIKIQNDVQKTQAEIAATADSADLPTEFQQAGIANSLGWNRMANFAIAIGLLLAGAKVASTIGGSSGNALSAVGGFAKKVATIGTGYAAGRWLYEKGAGAAKAVAMSPLTGAKALAWHAPVVGGKLWQMRAQNQWKSFLGAYHGKGFMPTKASTPIQAAMDAKMALLGTAKAEERPQIEKDIAELEARKTAKEKEMRDNPNDEEGNKKRAAEIGEMDNLINEGKASLGTVTNGLEREQIAREVEDLQGKLEKTMGGGVIGWMARQGIKTEKRLEKTKSQSEGRKKLLWKTTKSESGGWLFMRRDKNLEAQDRIERGWLQAEEARSKAKDQHYETKGKTERLVRSRFKDGRYETEFGTLQDQITRHEAIAATNEAETKSRAAESKRRFLGGAGQPELQAKIRAELHMKAEEAGTKKLEAGETIKLARQEGDVLKDIRRGVEAERQTHTEEEKLKVLKKEKETEYLGTRHGQIELEEEAELKLKLGKEEAQIKEAEAEFLRRFAGWDEGKQLIQATADAETGAKNGENVITSIKNKQWEDKYSEARLNIAKAVVKNPEEIVAYHAAQVGAGRTDLTMAQASKELQENKLNELANTDPYIMAAKLSQEAAWRATMGKVMQQETESKAKAAFIEKNALGFGTPSTAYSNLSDQLVKPMDSYDEPGRGAAASKSIQNYAGALKAVGGDLSKIPNDMKMAMNGVVSNLVGQGNLDDAAGAGIASDLDRLARGEVTDPEEKANIEAMAELFGPGGQFDVGIQMGADGKHQYVGNSETAGILQNWMISGGETAQLQTHREIERYQKENLNADGTKKSYVDASKEYFDGGRERQDEKDFQEHLSAQSKLAGRALSSDEAYNEGQKFQAGRYKTVDTLKEYKEKFGNISTQLLDGAEGFKKAGLSTKHAENIGHQQSDNDFGGVRFATADEAWDTADANIRKIEGSGPSQNVHAWGKWNYNKNRLIETNVRQASTNLRSANRYQDVGRMLDRTVDGILGYEASQGKVMDEENHGFLGGTKDAKELEQVFADELVKDASGNVTSTKVAGHEATGADAFIAKKVIPMLIAKFEALNNICFKKFGNVSSYQESEAMIHHLAIAGMETNGGKSEGMSQLIGNILTEYKDDEERWKMFLKVLQNQGSTIKTVKELKSQLEQRQQQATVLESRFKPKKTPTDTGAPTVATGNGGAARTVLVDQFGRPYEREAATPAPSATEPPPPEPDENPIQPDEEEA